MLDKTEKVLFYFRFYQLIGETMAVNVAVLV